VIINDLYFVELASFPNEAYSILIVDPNAVLTFSVAAQRLKMVPRGHEQIR